MATPTNYVSGWKGQFGRYVPVNGIPCGFVGQDGNMAPGNLDASGNIKVNVAAGSGSGYAGQADKSAFVEGTTTIAIVGGEYQTAPSAPTSGQAAGLRITSARGLHVNLRKDDGTEIGTLANPVRTDPAGATSQPVSLRDGSGNLITSTGGLLDVNASFSPASSTTASSPAQTATGAAAIVLASNASRKRVMIQNTGTVAVQFAYGGTNPTATAYHFTLPAAGSADDGSCQVWIDDMWKGAIRAFSASAGTIVVTELT